MTACAKREYEEETGIEIRSLVSLSNEGIPISSRQSTQRYFPYLGYHDLPIRVGESALDDNEKIVVVLMSVRELLYLIVSGTLLEECTISITTLALMRLKRLTLSD